jgi:Uma2 family endonuclease
MQEAHMATKTQKSGDVSTRKSLPRVSKPRTPKFVPRDSMLTVEQWAAMPDVKPRYELVNGKLVQKMTVTTAHAWAAGRMLTLLTNWGDSQGWIFFPEGTGVKLGEFDGSVPDLVGFQPGTKLNPKATYNTNIFLAVEVLSPSTAKRDRTAKKTGYEKIGVQLYILVDPDAQTMEVYSLQNAKYGAPQILKSGDVWQPEELAGLKLEVEKLWFK